MKAPRLVLMVIPTLALLAAPLAVEAQQTGRVHRLGFLSPGRASPNDTDLTAFRERLRGLGYVEGQNVVIETGMRSSSLTGSPLSRTKSCGPRWT
jgi:hypothetical protein